MPMRERAGYLERLADRLHEHRDELGLIDCVDAGNALSGMVGDVDWTVDTLRYFAGLVTEIKGETSSYGPRHMNFTRRQPYGVVAKINPFNHPFRFCAEKAAAALAAGNTVVVKGSDQAPLSSLRFGELCDGILPPGVVNVVTGGAATGSAMVRHPLVERIGFVGSVETGRIIAREAAEGLKDVTLELGGKNPFFIFPDADPAKAARAAVKGMNMNRQGQSVQLDLARLRARIAARGGAGRAGGGGRSAAGGATLGGRQGGRSNRVRPAVRTGQWASSIRAASRGHGSRPEAHAPRTRRSRTGSSSPPRCSTVSTTRCALPAKRFSGR